MNGLLRSLAGAAILAVAACGGSSTGPSGGGGGGSAGLTADIDGQAWAADAASLVVQAGSPQIPGSITITGTHVVSATNYTSLNLTLSYIGGPGTYPLGVNPVSTAGGIATLEQASGGLQDRSTPYSGAAGSVTITSLTATRIVGTFGFTATPILGSQFSGNRVVTNGAFDLALPAGFTSVPAANHGSMVDATLNGTAWNAATTVAQGNNGVIGFTATSDSYVLTMTSAVAVTTGTYNMDNTGFIVTADQVGSGTFYGPAGATGTVTITSDAGGRATGTFSGTLPGQNGSLTITGGTFDVRVDPVP